MLLLQQQQCNTMSRALQVSLVVAALIAVLVNAQREKFDSGEFYVGSRNPDGTFQCAEGGENTTAEDVSLTQCTAGCRSDPNCLSYNYRKPTAFEPKDVCEMFTDYPCYNLTTDGCVHFQKKNQPVRPDCPVGCEICCTAYGQLMACRADGCIPGYIHDGINGSCTDIDECASNPCLNGATCFNGINFFRCTCVPGYVGVQCQTDVNECASNPCVYGATCSDHVNSFSCACVPGYTGARCEIDINECASNPCRNGGSCIDAINYYRCRCTSGWAGIQCTTAVPSGYTLYITGDDVMYELYFDGSLVSLSQTPWYAVWYEADIVYLLSPPALIAVKVTNAALWAGILASDSLGHVTDGSWKCTTTLYPNWYLPAYVDTAWPAAWVRDINSNAASYWGQCYAGQPIADVALNANWIWAQGAGEAGTVYCRAHLV